VIVSTLDDGGFFSDVTQSVTRAGLKHAGPKQKVKQQSILSRANMIAENSRCHMRCC
jgi:hypothetical protein